MASAGELGDALRRIAADLPLGQLAEGVGFLETAHQQWTAALSGSTQYEASELLGLVDHALRTTQEAQQLGTLAQAGIVELAEKIGSSGPATGETPDTPPAAGDGRGVMRKHVDAGLVSEVQRAGHKISPDKVVCIGRDQAGRVVWIEEGNQSSRLAHILLPDRVTNFAGIGITKEDIVDVVFAAATTGRPIGLAGKDRPVFVVNYRGQEKRIAVTVASNGFVIGANPIGPNRKLRPLP